MRTIASLLFGRDAGELLDLITGEGGIRARRHAGDGDREAADRVLRSGEWCGSTPGRGSADRGRRGRAAGAAGSLSAAAGYNASPGRVNPICPWYERRVAGYA